VILTRQEWERQVIRGLAKYGYNRSIDKLRLLDAGCGNGSRLAFFISMGFSPEKMAGVDLIPERIQTAERLLPSGISLQCADISSYDGGQFDIITASVVLSTGSEKPEQGFPGPFPNELPTRLNLSCFKGVSLQKSDD
jgi:2-polyprenyl-3-methyl-5-hydroxy-6-metoxy-1,4-benzoquinol methylase